MQKDMLVHGAETIKEIIQRGCVLKPVNFDTVSWTCIRGLQRDRIDATTRSLSMVLLGIASSSDGMNDFLPMDVVDVAAVLNLSEHEVLASLILLSVQGDLSIEDRGDNEPLRIELLIAKPPVTHVCQSVAYQH